MNLNTPPPIGSLVKGRKRMMLRIWTTRRNSIMDCIEWPPLMVLEFSRTDTHFTLKELDIHIILVHVLCPLKHTSLGHEEEKRKRDEEKCYQSESHWMSHEMIIQENRKGNSSSLSQRRDRLLLAWITLILAIYIGKTVDKGGQSGENVIHLFDKSTKQACVDSCLFQRIKIR